MEIEEWLDTIKSDELAEMLDELWVVYEKVEKVAKNEGHACLAVQLLHATFWKDYAWKGVINGAGPASSAQLRELAVLGIRTLEDLGADEAERLIDELRKKEEGD